MPLATIVDVNNHYQSIVLGCVLFAHVSNWLEATRVFIYARVSLSIKRFLKFFRNVVEYKNAQRNSTK